MNPIFLLGGFFLLVMTAVGVIGFWLVNREQEESEPSTSRFQSDLVRDDSRQTWRSVGLELLHLLGAWIPSSEAKRAVMQRRLHAAGYRRTSDINAFFGMKCASAIVLSILFALAASGNQSMVPLSFMCGLGLGFLIPERFLDARIASHNDRLRRALPFALDLMVMSLEAGQALDQAILLSSTGIQVFAPELSAELTQVYLQTRTGMPRQEALRIMAERAKEPEVHKFCQLLIDSDRFGSSLAPTLRQHARFLRTRFRQKAQESARKLSVKLVIPIFFLIFPAILVVTLGPAMLTAMRTMHTLLP